MNGSDHAEATEGTEGTEATHSPEPVSSAGAPVPLDRELLRGWPLPLQMDGDKNDRGTVLVIGGSPRTVGAVVLAGLAALRMGAGRLQLAVAEPTALAVTVAVPEALVACLPVHEDGRVRPRKAVAEIEPLVERADAVLIGPGLVGDASTAAFLEHAIRRLSPGSLLVLDATAAKGVDDLCAVLDPVRGRLAITANRGELAALARACRVDDDGEAAAAGEADGTPGGLVGRVAAAVGAVITCFGDVAAADGRAWRTEAGTVGLGTSGSGDVLAGLVAGAAARCHDPAQALCWATYAHAQAGARLGAQHSTVGFLAREIAAEVPAVMRDVERGADGQHAGAVPW